jgi:transitional endoplasmic reticulum ATPase
MHRRLEKVFYEIRAPRLSWSDIGGLDDVKATLRQMVCLPITRRAELAGMGVEPPAGVMLWGPLGNGITMLAEACANEAGVTYAVLSGREMLGRVEAIEEAVDAAVEAAPCLLYMTDVDWLAPRAGADYRWSDGTERGKPPTFADPELTLRFVELIDRVQDAPGVTLLGSCYRIDVVDQAVLRDKDRFNRKVYVHPPTLEDRRAMLALFSGRFKLDPSVDLDAWAARTYGCVGWDVENLCRKAALAAVEAGRTSVVDGDLEKALAQTRIWLTPVMDEGYRVAYEADCPHHYAF